MVAFETPIFLAACLGDNQIVFSFMAYVMITEANCQAPI
jgi:hypothetical protein